MPLGEKTLSATLVEEKRLLIERPFLIKSYLRDIVLGVVLMHKCNIVQVDLSVNNIIKYNNHWLLIDYDSS